MKQILQILLLLTLSPFTSIGQDTTATWMFKIKSDDFKVSKKISAIPKQFYNVMSICCKHDIVVKPEEFRSGCVGSNVSRKLNWVAKHKKKKRWAISVSYGGRAYYVVNYFFDYDGGKLNVNGFHLRDRDLFEKSFELITRSMDDKRNERVDLDYDFKFEEDCKKKVKYHRK